MVTETLGRRRLRGRRPHADSCALCSARVVVLTRADSPGPGPEYDFDQLRELSDRTVDWSSEDPSVVEVDQKGIATARGESTVSVTATSEAVSGSVEVSGDLILSSLTAESYHPCRVTTDGTAHCWGMNSAGQLGDGATTHSGVSVRVSGPP